MWSPFSSNLQCPTTRTAVVEAMRAAQIGTAWGAAPTAAGQPVVSEHNPRKSRWHYILEAPRVHPPSLARNAE